MTARPSFLRSGWPLLTLGVAAVIAAVTIAALFAPVLLDLLARRPGAVAAGQWWRLITPLFVHDGGWSQIAFNLVAGLIAGTLVEKLFGRLRWLAVFFAGGLTGEIAGVWWQPVGAGTSVAIYGLGGALIAFAFADSRLPPQSRLGAAACLAGALFLVALHDIHGPPVFVGLALGLRLMPRSAPPLLA